MSSDDLVEIRRSIESHERRISNLENMMKEGPTGLTKALSIKEFMIEKQPTKDLDKTAVAGYYLEHYRNVSPFNIRDLVDLFGEAREPIPNNINDAVNKNIEKGLIMESKQKKDKKKTWTLTATGERIVENGFKKDK